MSADKSLKRFRMSRKSEVFMHLAIANGAFYFKQKIEDREKNDDREGLGFDYWACLLLIAYWQEALFYFYGDRLGLKSKLKEDYWKMLKRADNALSLGLAKGTGRRNSIDTLREIRNTIAHGKPLEEYSDSGEFIATSDEATAIMSKIEKNDWEKHINLNFLTEVYELTELIEKKIYEALKVHPAEVFSGNVRTMHYLGPAE